jgi:hypothetical protein
VEITEHSEPLPEIKLSPADKRIAAEIHNFVMKKRNKADRGNNYQFAAYDEIHAKI